MNLTPVFDQYLRHTALPTLELAFDDASGTVGYRWKADEPAFAMPVRVGGKDHWQVIRPTTNWQTMETPLPKDRFEGGDGSLLRERISVTGYVTSKPNGRRIKGFRSLSPKYALWDYGCMALRIMLLAWLTISPGFTQGVRTDLTFGVLAMMASTPPR